MGFILMLAPFLYNLHVVIFLSDIKVLFVGLL